MNKARMFEPLIGKIITQIERLTVIEKGNVENDSEALSDTLLFTLSDGDCFEILVDSEETIFKKIINKQDFVLSFSLEEDETVDCQPISENIAVPFTVASILETWASQDDPLLVAVDFLGHNKQSLLSILTETDEAEILESEEIKTIISQMIFDYGQIAHRWYDA